MWESFYRIWKRIVPRQRSHTLASVLILLIGLATTSTLAQSCPTSVDGNRLDRNTNYPSSYGFNVPVCKPDAFGGEICRINCDYVLPRNLQTGIVVSHFSVLGTWATRPNSSRSYSSYACKNISDTPQYVNSSSKVVDVLISNIGSVPAAQALGRKAAGQLVTALEPSAIFCPNAAATQSSVPFRTSQDGRFPEIEPGCKGKLPQGKVRSVKGTVEVYQYAFDKWKRITSEFPVYKCDSVRTTGHDSSATVFIITPSGAEDRIDIMADTILEIPGPPEFFDEANPPQGEGFFIELLKGTLRWVNPEPSADKPARRFRSPFNVRTPTIVIGSRGTDYVLSHDPVGKKDYVFLNDGSIEITAGAETLLLRAGQQVFAEKSGLSPVYELKPEVWSSITSGISIPNQSNFKNARQISDTATSGNKAETNGRVFVLNQQYTLLYQGKPYLTHYEKGTHEGRPIDLFYFWILSPKGGQAEQDGQKLWGRFVRLPATTYPDQSNVVWWIADYRLKGKRWVPEDIKGISVEVK